MRGSIQGKRVAILTANGFEESELQSPRQALTVAGASVDIVSNEVDTVTAWAGTRWGDSYPVDCHLDEALASNYEMLVIPGGIFNPDTLRMNRQALALTREFFVQHKPVGTICHGPWVLISAGVIEGRDVTSYPSVKDDLVNAGANWHDREVVCDNGLITSRSPADLAAFNDKLIEELAEGPHRRQVA